MIQFHCCWCVMVNHVWSVGRRTFVVSSAFAYFASRKYFLRWTNRMSSRDNHRDIKFNYVLLQQSLFNHDDMRGHNVSLDVHAASCL